MTVLISYTEFSFKFQYAGTVAASHPEPRRNTCLFTDYSLVRVQLYWIFVLRLMNVMPHGTKLRIIQGVINLFGTEGSQQKRTYH